MLGLLAALGGLTSACLIVVVLPLHLPWPWKLRWTIASNADLWAASGWAAAGYVLTEVAIDEVVGDWILVTRSGTARSRWMTTAKSGLAGGARDPRGLIEDWCARSTPLLLAETATTVSLHGPDGCITKLETVGDASDASSSWA